MRDSSHPDPRADVRPVVPPVPPFEKHETRIIEGPKPPKKKPAKSKAAAAKNGAAKKVGRPAKTKHSPADDWIPTSGAIAREIDPDALDVDEARKRCRAIYRIEKRVEAKKAAFDEASALRRAAKAEYELALSDLEREIQEQRFGPGPLFSPDGKGPAAK